jgi:predicted metal-dependent TIM-barrel fold hydrolase
VFDTHTHMDTRPYEDFELMGVAGVKDVLTLAHDPMRMSKADVLVDHFHKLLYLKSDEAPKMALTYMLVLACTHVLLTIKSMRH